MQRLGYVRGKRLRLDVRVRVLGDDGKVEDIGVRRIHLAHHIRQFAALPQGGWTVGTFVPLKRHGCQWAALPHVTLRRRMATAA